MVDIKTLLPELRELVLELAEDLLARATSDKQIDAGLREAFSQVEKGGRTAQAFEVWRDDYLDQVAVAWVLACVFVRFMEDNHLIDECWLAGEGDRRKLAEDLHELFFREHPHDTDREYFQYVFLEVNKIPAAKDLFAEGKTPLWAVAPSGDAGMKLLNFWREMDAESGHLKRSFQVESGDTRFLGDLYQELSERAKKKFALLQTPVFVEEFILDRTLTPALNEFGLEQVRMIDPTCGSGQRIYPATECPHGPRVGKRLTMKISLLLRELAGHGVELNPDGFSLRAPKWPLECPNDLRQSFAQNRRAIMARIAPPVFVYFGTLQQHECSENPGQFPFNETTGFDLCLAEVDHEFIIWIPALTDDSAESLTREIGLRRLRLSTDATQIFTGRTIPSILRCSATIILPLRIDSRFSLPSRIRCLIGIITNVKGANDGQDSEACVGGCFARAVRKFNEKCQVADTRRIREDFGISPQVCIAIVGEPGDRTSLRRCSAAARL